MSRISSSHHFSSESVCAGHPDKLCDAISDAILDAVLRQDPEGRVAVEVLASANQLTLAGEVTSSARIEFESIVREQIRRLGYTNPDWGFYDGCKVVNTIHEQSPEIAVGVNDDGAGDQGMMFGFACRETAQLLPLPIVLANGITRAIDEARESGRISYLRPDGKAQVIVRYEGDKPVGATHVTVAAAHDEHVAHEEVKADVLSKIINPALAEYGFEIREDNVVVNGTGVWHVPGPFSDAGLTGRKIVVDGYGGYARVGGGAFSGKDPSKVDRSGAYAARYLAKNIVAAGFADTCEVSLAYHIGAKKPDMVNIDTFDTAHASTEAIRRYADDLIVPTVKNILTTLDLKRPIYLQTAAYGHFGKDNLPWEQVVLRP